MSYPNKPNFNAPKLAERIAMFGKFEYTPIGNGNIRIKGNWAAENIVKVIVPQLAGVEGCDDKGEIFFHKKAVPQLLGFFAEVERRGLKNRIISFAGSFVPRFIRGSVSALSNHAFGSAFDINAPQNWLGQQPAKLGEKGCLLELVPIAHEFGFYWGGHFKRLDGMHFEVATLNKSNTAPAPQPTPSKPIIKELSIGSKGEIVRILQQKLSVKGFLKSSQIDGDFGRITRDAVINFQRSVGISADGIAGAETFLKLGMIED